MTPVPSELGTYSTRRLLNWRVRLVMLICAGGGVFFGGKSLLLTRQPTAQFWWQVLGTGLAVITFLLLDQRWALRWMWPLSILVVSVCYVFTAIAGMLSPSGEYETTAVLFIGAAMTTAVAVPWGVWPQVVTVLIGAAALGVAVLLNDGTLGVVATDAGSATVVAFALSIATAREVNRYRFGHRRELLRRRRNEAVIKRLSGRLEQRVAERTEQLQQANETLAIEVASRVESQRRLADTVDHSNAIISLKDLRGRYLLVNREFEAVFALSRSDVIGCADLDLFPPPLAQRLQSRDQEVLRTGVAISFEQELEVVDSTRSYVSVKFPLYHVAGPAYGVGAVATDITRLKRLQEELRQHQDELAHVLRLHTITEMAAGLAHELNQPLCAIANFAHGGARRLRGGSAEPHALLQAFERIATEGLRAGEIIRGIRNLVQRADPPNEAVDVNALAAEAVRLVEPRARERDVVVRLEGAAELPRVWADGAQIEQVMLNLLLNGVEAIDSAADGQREVVVTTGARTGGVEVAVRDTGDGMAPDVLEKLFTPFFTTKAGGLGLGLAISRSIIELHGGRLWAGRNAACRGTTFRFWLPVAEERIAANRPPSRPT